MNCLYCLYYFLKVKVTFTAYTAYTVAHMPTYIANRVSLIHSSEPTRPERIGVWVWWVEKK